MADIAGNPRMRRLTATALARGVVVVGDGATTPELTMRMATNLRVPVRPATSPRLAALSGAGLAAMAASRHPAAVDARPAPHPRPSAARVVRARYRSLLKGPLT